MELIHFLDSIDRQLLLALNNDYSNFWDNIMWLISAKKVWIPFYAAILYVVIRHWKKDSWLIVLGLIMCIVIADQTASGILKNVVQRLRPSEDPSIQNLVVLVNGDRGGGMYGFVSSHAANMFGLGILTSLLFRSKFYTVCIMAWAALVAYSRIFLGVHFPGDVLGGAIVGALSALLVYWLLNKIRPQLFADKNTPIVHTQIPVWTILGTLMVFLVYSTVLFT